MTTEGTRAKSRTRQERVRQLLATGPKKSRHTVQVTSFGGSGTTALYEHLTALSVDLPMTPGHFPYKHQRIPPEPSAVPPGFRVIYLLGDPRNAVLSVFRRGIQIGHYRGLRCAAPSDEIAARLTDLETFLAAGRDDFGIADHLDRWLTREPAGYAVLFLKFDALPASWPVVRDFLGLAPDAPCLTVKDRRSDWRELAEPHRSRLELMYADVAARIDALPATSVR